MIKDISGTDIAIWNSGSSISADEILETFCTMCVNEQTVSNAGTITEEEQSEAEYQGKTVSPSTTGYVVAIVILAIISTVSMVAVGYMVYLKKIENRSKVGAHYSAPSAQSMSIMSSTGQIPVVLSSPNNLSSLESS